MTRAVFLMALAAVVPCDALDASVVAGNSYSCNVRDASGAQIAELTISIRKTAEVPDGRQFDASVTPLWVSSRSNEPAVPSFEIPTSEAVLLDGRFLVVTTLGPPIGTPPIAPNIGIRLVLDGDEPVNNGYVVIYRQQAGSHFETVGTGPQGIGLCRMVRNGASK